jgi:hypothetical protein
VDIVDIAYSLKLKKECMRDSTSRREKIVHERQHKQKRNKKWT